ncbi:hypothetical protein JAAARDRAFT_657924 [Jaapia argillacea MUCL 33604]|uniref:Nephrocystin 3-like N-terminal domain-containing protein n=1 Tax=Jaapia argillacea MUCL 33604 TaxID=933084 RepID=A0A067PX18_9AGAM|nr:hypothetical protein JAAARDRAFT_657924 [Jaapia argillacea MUCL 33604]
MFPSYWCIRGPPSHPIQQLRLAAESDGASIPLCAVAARYDYREQRRPCLEGTRVGVLTQVREWMGDTPGGHEGVKSEPTIFWINGLAGTGKTTIAYTVAQECHGAGNLGASFFCSRDNAQCSDPMFVFNTIAYQLGIYHPPFRAAVSEALKVDPLVVYGSVSRQIEELIVEPMRMVDFPPCIVVVDALDECKDDQSTSLVLSSLSLHLETLSPLKFLITSRPEHNITTGFASDRLQPVTNQLRLHDVGLDVVETDIRRYFCQRLGEIRGSYDIENPWPSENDINALTQMSGGLFIFAATTVVFIEDKNYSDPVDQLHRLLHTARISGSSPHQHLDSLYLQVLDNAFPQISKELAGRLKAVLGSVVLLQDPLSPLDLKHLLGVPLHSVRATLKHLHSVAMVPDTDDRPIQIIHPTFAEFITDPSRCTNNTFTLAPQMQHTLLFRQCMLAMVQLRRDMCDIRDPRKNNVDISDLPERIQTRIPPYVQYACCHWASHLKRGSVSVAILDSLREFCTKRLLFWIEVCSVLGALSGAIRALHDARGFLEVRFHHFHSR